MKNLKKLAEKKCSSFKGKNKTKCIENYKRTKKTKLLESKQKIVGEMSKKDRKEYAQTQKDKKKYGTSVASALSNIRSKKSKLKSNNKKKKSSYKKSTYVKLK